MLKCSQWCVQWFQTEESVFDVCLVPGWFLVLRPVHTHLLLHVEEQCRRSGHTPARPFASHSFTVADARRVTLWLQSFWWSTPLPLITWWSTALPPRPRGLPGGSGPPCQSWGLEAGGEEERGRMLSFFHQGAFTRQRIYQESLHILLLHFYSLNRKKKY